MNNDDEGLHTAVTIVVILALIVTLVNYYFTVNSNVEPNTYGAREHSSVNRDN